MVSGPKVSPLGVPQGAPKSQILTANISITVSRSVICQMGRKIGSTRAFQKCIAWDGSPQGVEVPYKETCLFLPGDRYLALIGVKICRMVELCPVRGFLHFWWRYLYGSPNRREQNGYLDNLSSTKLRWLASYASYTSYPLMRGRAIHVWTSFIASSSSSPSSSAHVR